ncbi:hypothetical protein EDB86DRAFT_2826372 [Lactarius hatsudake]|nr:hypothetical protein EDB86DRAFT_2826372 [Lactarius hatsudake]
MSHSIQSPLRPELVELSRLSTKESTTSTVTIVKPSNEDQLSRTTSRGGQYKPSGRGGAGNAREVSDYSQRASIFDGPEDFSSTKGRELRSSSHPEKIVSTGRGGSGNVHSPSRDVIGARSSELLSTTEAEQAKSQNECKYDAPRYQQNERAASWEELVSELGGGFVRLTPPFVQRDIQGLRGTHRQEARLNLPLTQLAARKARGKPQGLRRIPPPKPPPQLDNGWAERHTQQWSLPRLEPHDPTKVLDITAPRK